MRALLKDFTPQALGTGLLVTVVGYASSVAVVIHGLAAVGASDAQIMSALLGLGLSLGLASLVLDLQTRMPIAVAWSTPAMALLIGMPPLPDGFAAATGAFIAAGVLIMLAGLWTPLGDLVARIPKPIANGMLAGILMKLCLAPLLAIGEVPLLALAVVVVWIVVGRFARLWASPAALVVALIGLFVSTEGIGGVAVMPSLAFVMPVFNVQAMISIALPVFIVTMASQNIPGLTVLATYGFRPRVRPIFLVTGAASAISALVGTPTANLAAITAALCAGPDAGPDPAKRYVAAIVAGLGHMAFGLLAGITTLLVTRSSPILIEAVAGLALIPAFGASINAAVSDDAERIPALATFLVTASGASYFGVGSAFWGLIAGVTIHLFYRAFAPAKS